MSEHRLVGRDGGALRPPPERHADGPGFGLVVQLGGRAMRIDVVDVVGGDSG